MTRRKVARFTDKELEYIYGYLEFEPNRKLYYKIQEKIRKQIKRYRDFDNKHPNQVRIK